MAKDYNGMPDRALFDAALYDPASPELVAALSARLDEVLDELNRKSNARITELEDDVANLEKRLEDVDGELAAANKQIGDLEAGLTRAESAIAKYDKL